MPKSILDLLVLWMSITRISFCLDESPTSEWRKKFKSFRTGDERTSKLYWNTRVPKIPLVLYPSISKAKRFGQPKSYTCWVRALRVYATHPTRREDPLVHRCCSGSISSQILRATWQDLLRKPPHVEVCFVCTHRLVISVVPNRATNQASLPKPRLVTLECATSFEV